MSRSVERALKKTLATAAAALLTLSAPRIAAQASAGEDGSFLIKGGTIVNPGGPRIPNTNILIRNNRIVDIGASVSAGDAKVIDATGKFVYQPA